MKNKNVIIIGGGLSGLTAAIHLARRQVAVTLFEKEEYPRHKVCGEYVSVEILGYLKELGLSLEEELKPPLISRLLYSTVKGNFLEADLPQGGMGISRYAFDDLLFKTATKEGVQVICETVTKADYQAEEFVIKTSSKKEYTADVVLGAFGKRSGMDKVMDRPFFNKPAPWLAVKSHFYLEDYPKDLVSLHNFKGGYCGLSKTESGAVNVCYLATYSSFKEQKDTRKYQAKILRENPFLNTFFKEARPLFRKPLTIAQVSFRKKKAVDEHILMLGDAAGLLHPLCGNGMAMAIHSAKIASEVVLKHFGQSNFRRTELEEDYKKKWNYYFRARLRTGKWLQEILMRESLAEISQSLLARTPFLLPEIIRRTHGKPIT